MGKNLNNKITLQEKIDLKFNVIKGDISKLKLLMDSHSPTTKTLENMASHIKEIFQKVNDEIEEINKRLDKLT